MKTFAKVLSMLILIMLVRANQAHGDEDMKMKLKLNTLTPEEVSIILKKGTERPFSGKFYKHQEKGIYVCRQCNAPLYRSSDKFESECGWPSFDDEIPGAVKHIPDSDGTRTEIVCAMCGGHLGHVFTGEGFTPKNTRHCVNSISIDFITEVACNATETTPNAPGIPSVSKFSARKTPETETAIFAGGCFWGMQYLFKEAKGVISTFVGFTGGTTQNPGYRQVCDSNTGHAEAIEVVFDPAVTSFPELAKIFFEIHDPTQADGQGPDIGDQYCSEIFYLNDAQRSAALELIRILEGKGLKIVTRLTPASPFWKAEDYHQDYYRKKGGTPYCHRRVKRF